MIPKPQKQTILAMRQQGSSYAEIADVLSISPNTVKSICRRSNIKAAQQGPVCKNCGKPLERTARAKPKTFCSNQCRYSWWNRVRGQRAYRCTCAGCGKEFISYGNPKRKFCGRECYLLSKNGEGLP